MCSLLHIKCSVAHSVGSTFAVLAAYVTGAEVESQCDGMGELGGVLFD